MTLPTRSPSAHPPRPFTAGTRFKVLERDHWTCRYCGRQSPDVVLHVDHVIPRAEGGSNKMDNLVTACSDCNLGKSARPLLVPPPSGTTNKDVGRPANPIIRAVTDRRRLCVVCQQPMRSLKGDWLVLDDTATLKGPLADLPRNYFVHGSCVHAIGDRGYGIELRRIVRPNEREHLCDDSLDGWKRHLAQKNWFAASDAKWLDMAHEEAVRIAEHD